MKQTHTFLLRKVSTFSISQYLEHDCLGKKKVKNQKKKRKKVRIFLEPGEEADIEVGNGEKGGTWGEGARGYAEARNQVGLWRIRRSMRSIRRRSFVFIVSF